jgi:hypothetical protein
MKAVFRYLRNVLLGLDQLANVILAADNPDETISSSVGRKAAAGRRWAIAAEGMIDALFAVLFGQRHHCANNIELDEIAAAAAEDIAL